MVKTAVLFTPFWRQAGHVGNNRIDRFLRWLVADGFYVVIVRAGSVDGQTTTEWGMEITVRDPLGLYRDNSPTENHAPTRKPNKLRRALSYWLFNPDPSIVWAYAAARHPAVIQAAANATFILSSNPPESAHVGACELARRLGLPLITDMRDGWLDEPLKPLLRTSAFRRWREGRLEIKILRAANAILVTSDVWQELLCKRHPELNGKVTVLTNGYPSSMPKPGLPEHGVNTMNCVLIHAGRFLGSRLTQSPDLLLQPLLDAVTQNNSQGSIQLIGSLNVDESAIIAPFAQLFLEQGWTIECTDYLNRPDLLKLLPKANGLLLLSASYAAIPSKLFEYIPTGKPILAVTEAGSATWRICRQLPQAFLIESGLRANHQTLKMFIDAVFGKALVPTCPAEYSENEQSKKLLAVIEQLTKNRGHKVGD